MNSNAKAISNWYYHDGQKQIGPIHEHALHLLIDQGVVGPQHLVFGPGLTEWQPASTLSDSQQGSGPAVPPAPPAYAAPALLRATTPARTSLWNPSAAANWCLLFGVPFGSFLHARNWAALGEHTKSRNAWIWFYVTSTLVLLAMLSNPAMAAGIGAWTLILWYFISGRAQIKFVAHRYAANGYDRKAWTAPLLIAFGVMFVLFILAFVVLLAQAVTPA